MSWQENGTLLRSIKYDVINEIVCNTEVLKSNLSYYKDAYILVKRDIAVTTAPATQVPLKHYAKFTKWIAKLM